MAFEPKPKQWTWQDYIQFLLDLHEDVLNKVTAYWDHNDLLTLELVSKQTKQKLRTLISDAFKQLKFVKLDDLFPEVVKILKQCGTGLKIVDCTCVYFEPNKQYDEDTFICAETLARQSPNIVEFRRAFYEENDKHVLKLIIGYISQLRGRCKLRTVRINYGYERFSELAKLENQILNGSDSIENIKLGTSDSKAIGNVQKYLEMHGDRIKKMEIGFIRSAIEVAVEFSSYLKAGCRLIVEEYNSDYYDSTTLKQHLSILQNRTDLDRYVHIDITDDPDPLPFDIIKSIKWNKKWDYQKLVL